jgi:hypothetical protein
MAFFGNLLGEEMQMRKDLEIPFPGIYDLILKKWADAANKTIQPTNQRLCCRVATRTNTFFEKKWKGAKS